MVPGLWGGAERSLAIIAADNGTGTKTKPGACSVSLKDWTHSDVGLRRKLLTCRCIFSYVHVSIRRMWCSCFFKHLKDWQTCLLCIKT